MDDVGAMLLLAGRLDNINTTTPESCTLSHNLNPRLSVIALPNTWVFGNNFKHSHVSHVMIQYCDLVLWRLMYLNQLCSPIFTLFVSMLIFDPYFTCEYSRLSCFFPSISIILRDIPLRCIEFFLNRLYCVFDNTNNVDGALFRPCTIVRYYFEYD